MRMGVCKDITHKGKPQVLQSKAASIDTQMLVEWPFVCSVIEIHLYISFALRIRKRSLI